jgi:hypothetical protein
MSIAYAAGIPSACRPNEPAPRFASALCGFLMDGTAARRLKNASRRAPSRQTSVILRVRLCGAKPCAFPPR